MQKYSWKQKKNKRILNEANQVLTKSLSYKNFIWYELISRWQTPTHWHYTVLKAFLRYRCGKVTNYII